MTKILITEFIDSQSLQNINKKFDVIYKIDAWQNKDFFIAHKVLNNPRLGIVYFFFVNINFIIFFKSKTDII